MDFEVKPLDLDLPGLEVYFGRGFDQEYMRTHKDCTLSTTQKMSLLEERGLVLASMPELIESVQKSTLLGSLERKLENYELLTGSLVITGLDQEGKPAVAVSHEHVQYLHSENLRRVDRLARDQHMPHWRKAYGPEKIEGYKMPPSWSFPKDDFYRLLQSTNDVTNPTPQDVLKAEKYLHDHAYRSDADVLQNESFSEELKGFNAALSGNPLSLIIPKLKKYWTFSRGKTFVERALNQPLTEAYFGSKEKARDYMRFLQRSGKDHFRIDTARVSGSTCQTAHYHQVPGASMLGMCGLNYFTNASIDIALSRAFVVKRV